jgi:hypothetical protein
MGKKFSSKSVKVEVLEGNQLRLLEDFSYLTDSNILITVTKGFVFDGASIPKFFWRVIGHPFSSKYIRSALIHDILYMTEAMDRKVADKTFKEMLKHDRVESWKIPLMYNAVRVGGGSVWKNHKQKEVAKAHKFIKIEGGRL